MTRTFRSEWVKLARPATLLGTVGAMAGFVALANFGFFRIASMQAQRAAQGPPQGMGRSMASIVGESAGWLLGVRGVANMLGLVALIAFASNVGGEYKNGTLRFLLAGEPRRLHLLAGKALALGTLVVGAVFVAMLVGLVTAYAFAGLFDLDAGPWLSADGLQRALQAFLNVSASALGWGVIGAFLAVALRTSAAAIGIGVGYLLVGEAIISRAIVASVFDTESVWFPGEVLRTVAAGGSPASGFTRAAVLSVLYVAAFAGIAATMFHRRDVLT